MSSNSSRRILAVLASAGALAAGAAQARTNVDIQLGIGLPGIGVVIGAPVYAPPPRVIVAPAPMAYPAYRIDAPAPRYGRGHGTDRRGWGDRDHDGVPNRYDRYDNPPNDRNGNGVPDRREHGWRR